MIASLVANVALCASLVAARGIPSDGTALLDSRALPNSPSGGYAPKIVDCPSTRPTIRGAGTLSPQEQAWLSGRRKNTIQPMKDLLKAANIANFDAEAYINRVAGNLSQLPNIGIAVSGGGYRALMNGGGFLAAADSRTPGATDKGGIGGLLQASTYLAGLSGGGWLVGSIYGNNFSSVVQMRDGFQGSSVYKFDASIFAGPAQGSGLSILNTASYWSDIASQVAAKDKAGFETSITDYWGRALSYQLINDRDGGPAYTFSSIADMDSFKQGQTPFPILVADGRAPNDKIVSLNSSVFEFNAFEMGTFDPTTFGFAPTKYIASNFSSGTIPPDGHCVAGFDQAGFVMGTSSSLFNTFLLQNISTVDNVPSIVLDGIKSILTSLGDANNDIAQYVPNPFHAYNPTTNPSAAASQLSLVDGGEDLQNIPLHPLIQPLRGVDVIFAVDSSADTEFNWPNGTALRASYERSKGAIANGTLFPPVPDERTFINLRLNQRPTFFGCDVRNFTLASDTQVPPPLVVYIPNAPYTAMSNVSTFTPSYKGAQRNDIIRNGYEVATLGNGTNDADWTACVACAVLSRSLAKTGTAVPGKCGECFQRYCWDGTVDTRDVGRYEPGFIIRNGTTEEKSGAVKVGGRGTKVWLGVAVGVLGVLVW